jgi:formate dehydrogenase subunit delta
MSHGVDRLVYMANQIARELSNQQPHEAAVATRDHLQRYWDPRMRSLIIKHFRSGGPGLEDIARDAIATLERHKPPPQPNEAPGSDQRSNVG